MTKAILKIDGMHCDKCATRLGALLSKEPGVREASVSFDDRAARLTFNPQTVEEARLVEIVTNAGFRVPVQSQ